MWSQQLNFCVKNIIFVFICRVHFLQKSKIHWNNPTGFFKGTRVMLTSKLAYQNTSSLQHSVYSGRLQVIQTLGVINLELSFALCEVFIMNYNLGSSWLTRAIGRVWQKFWYVLRKLERACVYLCLKQWSLHLENKQLLSDFKEQTRPDKMSLTRLCTETA